jgi:hypothetical protein
MGTLEMLVSISIMAAMIGLPLRGLESESRPLRLAQLVVVLCALALGFVAILRSTPPVVVDVHRLHDV